MTQYRAISLFSGCGGLDLGALETRRVKISLAVDNDEWAVETYRRNLGNHVVCADARSLRPVDTRCDLLLAGPPCQDFSSLWNLDGARTSRGNLFREVSRYLAFYKPLAFVMENVPGLLSANRGQAWTLVRYALKFPQHFLQVGGTLSYRLRVEKLNMADLGVPQNRERLIIRGFRADLGAIPKRIEYTHRDAHITVREALTKPALPEENTWNHELPDDSADVVARLKLIPPGGNYEAIPLGHALSVRGLISHVYKRLDPEKPAYTIIAGGGGGTYGYHFEAARSLTNRERARLQSFPDDFVFVGPRGAHKRSSIASIRRQIGNAVPPVAARAIVSQTIKQLDSIFQYDAASGLLGRA